MNNSQKLKYMINRFLNTYYKKYVAIFKNILSMWVKEVHMRVVYKVASKMVRNVLTSKYTYERISVRPRGWSTLLWWSFLCNCLEERTVRSYRHSPRWHASCACRTTASCSRSPWPRWSWENSSWISPSVSARRGRKSPSFVYSCYFGVCSVPDRFIRRVRK